MLGQPIFLNRVLIQIFVKQLVEIIKKNYYYFEIDLLEFLFEFPPISKLAKLISNFIFPRNQIFTPET